MNAAAVECDGVWKYYGDYQRPRQVLQHPGPIKDLRLIPPRQVTVGSATGLWVSCYVYRGAGKVHITPDQPKPWEDTRAGANSQWAPLWQAPPPPPDNNWTATATFAFSPLSSCHWRAARWRRWQSSPSFRLGTSTSGRCS